MPARMNPADEKSELPGVAAIFRAGASALQREDCELWERLLANSRETLRGDPTDERARQTGAWCLQKLGRFEEAIVLLAEGAVPGASPGAHLRYINLLEICNRTREAIAAAGRALSLFPGNVLLQMKEALLLPVLYDSPEEIESCRDRYTAGLDRLKGEIRLGTKEERRHALEALAGHTNVYLAYQGRDDRDLQTSYGRLAHRIMAANYPQWTRRIEIPLPFGAEPIRIGYVSSRFRDLSATRFFLGWLRGHDRKQFEIHSWHVGQETDMVTGEVRQNSHAFHHMAGSLEQICESIRAENLQVLVFLDLGLDPLMTQLAALRLAPVQCMAWDHPVTSGLPTIDYALNGALSEPDGAEAHYFEKLVRLPGVGVSYRKPVIPVPLLRKTRQDFQLQDDSVVYLCCQSVFKFLPDNDDVFVRIAQRVPRARFVFLVTNSVVGGDLRKRLTRAFSVAGLCAENHCVLLPQLKHLDYWNLHLVGDIFLDTIGWSSGGSIFEAIACRLPVITLPGELARSRQGYAILTQLKVTETIANDKASYVEIAVRLGMDGSLREEIVGRMVRGYPLLYSDTRSVTALEEFFREQACGLRPGDPPAN